MGSNAAAGIAPDPSPAKTVPQLQHQLQYLQQQQQALLLAQMCPTNAAAASVLQQGGGGGAKFQLFDKGAGNSWPIKGSPHPTFDIIVNTNKRP